MGFVAKFDPTGSTLQYATYIGGTGSNQVNAIAVDGTGALVATGQTDSPNFPIVNAAQSTFRETTLAFVLKLNSAGDNLVYSTYLGASWTTGNAIAVDPSGGAYVTGNTEGLESSALQGAFVTKLTSIGTESYSSVVMAGQSNIGRGITVDSQGAAYVCGQNYILSSGSSRGFVLKVSADGSVFTVRSCGSWL